MAAVTANIPETMIAYRFKPSCMEPVREEIPVPSIGPDEVLLQILAGGVCHSDLSILDPNNSLNKFMVGSFTMGHEGAGIVVALGSAVPDAYPEIKAGAYVAVFGANACFDTSCAPCSLGRTNLCRTYRNIGLGCDGSWAQYLALRASCVVPVPADPETLPPAVATAATDAVLTPYHAMKTCCRIQPGQTVLCMGAGGLGLNAIAIAKNCLGAACVISCDLRESSRMQAVDMGADHALHPDELVKYITEKKLLVDVAVDFVGIQASFDACYAAIKHGGIIHTVGLAGPPVEVNPLTMMLKDATLKYGFWGRKDELAEVLQAIAEGKIKPKVELRPMNECAQVLKEMHDGTLKNRICLVP